MTTFKSTTLDTFIGRHQGKVATDRLNTLRLRRQLVLDIASDGGGPMHEEVKAFFTGVPWFEQVPSVNAMAGALDYLDQVPASSIEAVHILLGGDGDQLRFRVHAAEAVRIYEMPVELGALGSRILHEDMLAVWERKAPAGLDARIPIIVHGCDNGAHDGLLMAMWYAFGCLSPLYLPQAALSYEFDGRRVHVTASPSANVTQPFRRIDLASVGDWSF